MAGRKKRAVALVDDGPVERALVKKAVSRLEFEGELRVYGDAEEFLTHLEMLGTSDAAAGDIEAPELVILDLNMPGKSGLEVLKALRADRRWHHMMVLVFSTSSEEEEVLECYREGANAFISKPIGFEKLVSRLESTFEFWLQVAQPPPKTA